MSATPDRKKRKDLLEVLASRHTLPEGCDTWAIKSVRPDLTTRGGSFQWPFPGGVVEASGVVPENRSPVPSREGDGVCAGKTWRGMATARIPAITLLLVAYSAAEHLLGADGDKVRLRCAHVVALVDGAALLVKDGAESDLSGAHLDGAYLRGAHLIGADLSGAHLDRAYLTGADLSGALRRSDAPAGWTIRDEGVLVRTSNGDEWADESTIREVPE